LLDQSVVDLARDCTRVTTRLKLAQQSTSSIIARTNALRKEKYVIIRLSQHYSPDALLLSVSPYFASLAVNACVWCRRDGIEAKSVVVNRFLQQFQLTPEEVHILEYVLFGLSLILV